MNFFSLIGAGMVVAVICVLLRQYKPEYAMLASLAAGVVMLLMIVSELRPAVAQISLLMDKTQIPTEYVGILMKSLGICIVTQIACDTCKDAGENGISTKIEMAGKVAVLVCSLPLFGQVLGIVQNLLRLV